MGKFAEPKETNSRQSNTHLLWIEMRRQEMWKSSAWCAHSLSHTLRFKGLTQHKQTEKTVRWIEKSWRNENQLLHRDESHIGIHFYIICLFCQILQCSLVFSVRPYGLTPCYGRSHPCMRILFANAFFMLLLLFRCCMLLFEVVVVVVSTIGTTDSITVRKIQYDIRNTT